MNYVDSELITRVKQLPDFKDKLKGKIPEDYWIIGIRNPEDKPNKFDDMFYLMRGEKIILWLTGTTNPGTPVLKKGYLKYNKDGAAVIEANRIYPGVWRYGLHQGKIPALKQIRPMTIYRDGDNDDKSEEIGKKRDEIAGINFHPDQHDPEKDTRSDDKDIGWWSAGCQVANQMPEYNRIITATMHQKDVTYCLLEEFSI